MLVERQWFRMRLLAVVLNVLLAVGVNGRLNSAGFTVTRPNFIVFMADDLGYGDLGFTGNQDVETPNIDALARESVFFPNFYVAPVCTPTRAALLTGRCGFVVVVHHSTLFSLMNQCSMRVNGMRDSSGAHRLFSSMYRVNEQGGVLCEWVQDSLFRVVLCR